MTAVTALTAQNTLGVHGVVGVEPEFIRQQIEVVVGDLGVDTIKTGMLHSGPVIETVAGAIRDLAPGVPLVVDPVMVAKGGAPLLESGAVDILRDTLLPMATIITPNLPEAGVLLDRDPPGVDSMADAAAALLALGPGTVLLKGGHLESDDIVDLLAAGNAAPVRWTAKKIDTSHTHGTGCTLASAVAAGLAQGLDLEAAVSRARDYVRGAILTAPGYGAGHGPVNHAHPIEPG